MKKNYLIALGVGVVVLSLAVAFATSKREEAQTPVPTATPTSLPTPTPTPAVPSKPKATPPAASKAYMDALNIYGDTGSKYRFQFSDCQAFPIPQSMTIKSGVKFMIDNRDDTSHKFSIGSANYNIAAWGFTIATAPKAGTYNFTCDGNTRASLIVQP